MEIAVKLDVDDEDEIIRVCRIVSPCWSNLKLRLVVFKEGTTNTLFACIPVKTPDDASKPLADNWDGAGTVDIGDRQVNVTNVDRVNTAESPIIVRIFGANTEYFIDRASELHYLKQLSKSGLAACVLAEFQNGLIYRYVSGITLTRELFRDRKLANAIAAHLSAFHNADIKPFNDNKQSILFPQLYKYVRMLNSQLQSHGGSDHLRDNVRKAEAFIPKLHNKMIELFGHIDTVFCHNDLLATNVVYNRETSTVRFIDFEYSGYNYASYDVANHFNEFAGMTNPMYSLIPKHDEILPWCESYLHYRLSRKPVNDELNRFVAEVEFFMPISHLFWSLWSFLQSFNSRKKFNYFDYAVERFNIFISAMDDTFR